MARLDLKARLYARQQNPNAFDFNKLTAPRIHELISPTAVGDLASIASSLKYNGRIDTKHKMMNEIMRQFGFKFDKRGTNRSVYIHPDVPTIVAKVAVDRVGMSDNPAEFKNQMLINPYCCKMFETDPTGAFAFVEKVHPITSIEEYDSVSGDIYDMYMQITGKRLVYDIGTDRYMNIGLRIDPYTGQYFGPVVLDYPYLIKIDGSKLKCNAVRNINGKPEICNGDIDIDVGFNELVCEKCGRKYLPQDIALKEQEVPYSIKTITNQREVTTMSANARIVDGNGNVIKSSGKYSKTFIEPKEYSTNSDQLEPGKAYVVDKTIRLKREPIQKFNEKMTKSAKQIFYDNLQKKIEADAMRQTKNKVYTTIAIDKNVPTDIKPVPYIPDEEDEPIGSYVVDEVVDINDVEHEVIPEYEVAKAVYDIINGDTGDLPPEEENIDTNSYAEEESVQTEESELQPEDGDISMEEISTEEEVEQLPVEDTPIISDVSTDVDYTSDGEEEVIVVNTVGNTENLSDEDIDIRNAKSIAEAIYKENLDMDILREMSYLVDPEDGFDTDQYEKELYIINICRDYKVNFELVEAELDELYKHDNSLSEEEQNPELADTEDNHTISTDDDILNDY